MLEGPAGHGGVTHRVLAHGVVRAEAAVVGIAGSVAS